MYRLAVALLAVVLVAGCKHDTRPVPQTLTGDMIYKDYRKQPRTFPLTAKETNAVLVRTDLKSTGDIHPAEWANDRGTVRFIYGGKYYYAYESNIRNPKDGPQMYGPYDLP